jgi:hypothetical protein
MESRALDKSSSASGKSSAPADRSEVLVAKLARFYSVVGSRPDEPGALALMAEILTQSATDEEIDGALTRCARECPYPIRLPDILQRIQGQEIPQLEAEGRKAWDSVISFVSKWVQSDVQGDYVITRGVRSSEPPRLAQRILDTVQRTGGWKIYKCMTHEDFPFVQKRFLEEYEAWTAVEQIALSKLLTEMPRLQLVAKPMDPPRYAEPKAPQPGMPAFKPKSIPVPLTDAQLRDRREMLRQQAASLAKSARFKCGPLRS